MFGGYDANGNESRKVYEFNTATLEWKERDETMPFPVVHGAAVALPPTGIPPEEYGMNYNAPELLRTSSTWCVNPITDAFLRR